jgi:calcineurin-like phosphoesterase family protein
MIFFTSDQHFFHQGIVDIGRPFKNSQEMDRIIIRNYNRVISDEDIVYHLGDLSLISSYQSDRLKNVVEKLSGRKILILGNHDSLKPFKYVDVGFESVHTSLEIEIEALEFDGFPKKKILLNHDPVVSIVNKHDLYICGHVHTMFKSLGKIINVGVDVWGFTPVNLDDILSLIKSERIWNFRSE